MHSPREYFKWNAKRYELASLLVHEQRDSTRSIMALGTRLGRLTINNEGSWSLTQCYTLVSCASSAIDWIDCVDVDWLSRNDSLTVWLTDWLSRCLIDWLTTDWRREWLSGCLTLTDWHWQLSYNRSSQVKSSQMLIHAVKRSVKCNI